MRLSGEKGDELRYHAFLPPWVKSELLRSCDDDEE